MTQPDRGQPDPGQPDPGQPDPGQPDPGPSGPQRPEAEEPVGGLGEEAVKLLFALRGLAGDPSDGVPEGAASALRGAAASAQRIGDHLGDGSGSCRYCPVCQAISLVRATPPEVRHHLAAAGTSLLRAVSSLMDPPDPSARPPQQPPAGPQTNRGAGADDEWEDD